MSVMTLSIFSLSKLIFQKLSKVFVDGGQCKGPSSLVSFLLFQRHLAGKSAWDLTSGRAAEVAAD